MERQTGSAMIFVLKELIQKKSVHLAENLKFFRKAGLLL